MTAMQLPFPDDAPARPRLTEERLCELFGIPFTDEQINAITAPHASAVVIAGAGSGKTSLMSARVVWLVANGAASPDEVLGLTFTNKAAAELSSRVRAALRRLEVQGEHEGLLADGEPTVSTYHAYAASLLREYGLWAGLEPAAQMLTDGQRFELAESVVRKAPGPFPALGVKVKAVTERVVALDGELSEHLVSIDALEAHDRSLIAELDELERHEGSLTSEPDRARVTARARLELAGLVSEYRRRKHELERVDFGDLMASAAFLAEGIAEVARGERERFATVLLDEYQDTSMAQQRLLVALFGDGHPVMAVGDPFQSIYGWRGASIRNILSFTSDFSGASETPVFALGQNNRSGGTILAAANVIAEPLRDELPEVTPLRPRPGQEGAGEVSVGLYATAAEEIEAVCDAVALEVAQGRAPADVAVLCRETKTFPDILAGLTSRKVPVDVVGLSGLIEVPEVVDVISVLEVLHEPTANPQMVRILSGPRWRIGPVDLAHLGRRAKSLAETTSLASTTGEMAPDELANGFINTEPPWSLAHELQQAVAGTDAAEAVSLLEALEDPGALPYSSEARERFAALSAELRSLRRVIDLPPDAAITQVVEALALDVELAVENRPRDHLDALVEQARLFASSGGGTTVGPFLAYLRLAERYGDTLSMGPPTGGGGVSLLTVHKAKGLEWHSVYVPSVVDGVFPNTRSRSTPYSGAAVLPYALRGDALDFPKVSTWTGNQGVAEFKQRISEREAAEDRRLAYVAVTRAAQRLVVTGHRWGPSQQKPRQVSTYLLDLREMCDEGHVLSWASEPVAGETNPMLELTDSYPWPVRGDAEAAERRKAAAAMVLRSFGGAEDSAVDGELDSTESSLVAEWDRDIEALIVEARRSRRSDDSIPSLVSATGAIALLREPVEARRRIRRPLPRPPAEAARRGTLFHEWVEARFGQVPLLDLEGFGDDDDEVDGAELAAMQKSFLDGPYADRQPVAVEAPFQMVLGSATVAGRIDAVYAIDGADDSLPPDARYEVVDWKTGQHRADELQLALYRVAWAELMEVPVEQVVATFYYVTSGVVERPEGLPDREGLTLRWTTATTFDRP